MGFPYFGNNNDFPFLPPGVNGDVQVFTYNTGNIIYQPWSKPKGVSTVFMLLIGAGSGGGGGATNSSTTARGGGGGGSPGGIASHIFSATVLPDNLKIFVPKGGTGGTAGNTGGNGTSSRIATGDGVTAGTTRPNIIAQSDLNCTGGSPGTGAGNAAAGGAGNPGTKAGQGWAQAFSFSSFIGGIVGATGGVATGGAGTDFTAAWNTTPLSGGAGGGGVNGVGTGFAGGGILLQSALDFADGSFTPATTYIPGGIAGSGAAAGGNGNAGVQSFRPFIMTGGSGGGSADGQAGGRGGDGGFGCGGGGGGGGTTGGAGGDGGDGLVIIISW